MNVRGKAIVNTLIPRYNSLGTADLRMRSNYLFLYLRIQYAKFNSVIGLLMKFSANRLNDFAVQIIQPKITYH